MLSIRVGALVACADFLLCVFLCDGTVALCNCLEDTETFGLGYAKGCVWCHVVMAPVGAWRWWTGGRTWHATHTPRPCHAGKGLPGWCTLGECLFRQTLWRFYGLIIEAIYWLSVWHTCAHTHAKPSRREQTHTQTQRNTNKRRNEISNSGKTTSHRWTHSGKNMQRITRLYIEHSVHIYTQHLWSARQNQRISQGVNKTTDLAFDRCV